MELGNYEILVAEPWDYESRDGKNSIKGEIIKIVSGKCAVFKSNFLLEFNKLESHYLILTPRMKDGDFYSENITSTIINGALLPEIEPCPRIIILAPSAPGFPDCCCTVTPGAKPCKA